MDLNKNSQVTERKSVDKSSLPEASGSKLQITPIQAVLIIRLASLRLVDLNYPLITFKNKA